MSKSGAQPGFAVRLTTMTQGPRRPGRVLFTNWPVYLAIARQARDEATEIMSGNPNEVPTEALVAIVMSALATEAFINELTEWADMTTANVGSGAYAAYDLLRDLANTLTEVEANKGSTALKYQIAAKVLSESSFPRSEAPFQNFGDLLSLRNQIVHLRPGDEVGAHGQIVPRVGLIRNFQRKGLTRTRGQQPSLDTPGMSWLMEIQTASMAAWAYQAATGIIRAVGQMLPEESGGTMLFGQNIPA
jgi:hypothetical protein